MTLGPDGAVWFTQEDDEVSTNQIGRITPRGAVSIYLVPTAYSDPYGIAAGPDGA